MHITARLAVGLNVSDTAAAMYLECNNNNNNNNNHDNVYGAVIMT